MHRNETPVLKFYTPVENGRYKFIVVHLLSQNDIPQRLIRCHRWLENIEPSNVYHAGIVEMLRVELGLENPLNERSLGGGTILIDLAKKQIRIVGQSRNYGAEHDRELTFEEFRRAYPDFDVSSK